LSWQQNDRNGLQPQERARRKNRFWAPESWCPGTNQDFFLKIAGEEENIVPRPVNFFYLSRGMGKNSVARAYKIMSNNLLESAV